MQISTR